MTQQTTNVEQPEVELQNKTKDDEGKAGEADIIIGIGKNPGEDDDTRFLNVSKNKISGWHGHVVCEIDKLTGRYYE